MVYCREANRACKIGYIRIIQAVMVTPVNRNINNRSEWVSDFTGLGDAVTYGVLAHRPPPAKIKLPMVIDGSLIIIYNPVAGSGKAGRYFDRLHGVIGEMLSTKKLVVKGDVVYLRTRDNPGARAASIIRQLSTSERPPTVVAVGGDGTSAEVAEALWRASREGSRYLLIAGPGGTAGDMRYELGVPSNPKKFPQFLAEASRVEIPVITASMDAGSERLVIHSQGAGVSGVAFDVIQKLRSGGKRVSVFDYIRGLVGPILDTETFYIKVNGGNPLPVGEVIMLTGSTSIGGVTRIPLPVGGGRLHAIEVYPGVEGPVRLIPGLKVAADAFRRGGLFMLGGEGVIAPGSVLCNFPKDRSFDIGPGDSPMVVEFVDSAGQPKPIKSILNGDPYPGEVSRVTFRATGETVSVLAAPHSGIMIRKGLTAPSTVTDKFASVVGRIGGRSAAVAPVALIAGVEVYKDSINMTEDERSFVDSVVMAELVAVDAFAVSAYGALPYVSSEMPLIIPPFLLGEHIATGASDYLGRSLGANSLRHGKIANRLVGIGGGFGASYGVMKYFGAEVWHASVSRINYGVVRYIGGAGAATEGFIQSFFNFLKPILSSFPIFIPRYIEDELIRDDNLEI